MPPVHGPVAAYCSSFSSRALCFSAWCPPKWTLESAWSWTSMGITAATNTRGLTLKYSTQVSTVSKISTCQQTFQVWIPHRLRWIWTPEKYQKPACSGDHLSTLHTCVFTNMRSTEIFPQVINNALSHFEWPYCIVSRPCTVYTN